MLEWRYGYHPFQRFQAWNVKGLHGSARAMRRYKRSTDLEAAD